MESLLTVFTFTLLDQCFVFDVLMAGFAVEPSAKISNNLKDVK